MIRLRRDFSRILFVWVELTVMYSPDAVTHKILPVGASIWITCAFRHIPWSTCVFDGPLLWSTLCMLFLWLVYKHLQCIVFGSLTDYLNLRVVYHCLWCMEIRGLLSWRMCVQTIAEWFQVINGFYFFRTSGFKNLSECFCGRGLILEPFPLIM
jgi:hypothetical protein